MWKSEMDHGDLQKMAESAGVSYITVYRAIKSQECKQELFKALSGFIKTKKEAKRNLLTEA